jgi:hypothetical protein
MQHQVMHHVVGHAGLVRGAAAIARHMWVQHRGQEPERRWPEGCRLVVTLLHKVEAPGVWTLRGQDLGSGDAEPGFESLSSTTQRDTAVVRWGM